MIKILTGIRSSAAGIINIAENLKVSDKRYWICNSTKFNCCQVLAYDEQYKIPFRSEHEL